MRRLSLAILLAGCGEPDPCDVVREQLESDVATYFTAPDGSFDAWQVHHVRGDSWEFVACDEPRTIDGEGIVIAHSVAHNAITEYTPAPTEVEIAHRCELVRYDQGLTAECQWF